MPLNLTAVNEVVFKGALDRLNKRLDKLLILPRALTKSKSTYG